MIELRTLEKDGQNILQCRELKWEFGTQDGNTFIVLKKGLGVGDGSQFWTPWKNLFVIPGQQTKDKNPERASFISPDRIDYLSLLTEEDKEEIDKNLQTYAQMLNMDNATMGIVRTQMELSTATQKAFFRIASLLVECADIFEVFKKAKTVDQLWPLTDRMDSVLEDHTLQSLLSIRLHRNKLQGSDGDESQSGQQ